MAVRRRLLALSTGQGGRGSMDDSNGLKEHEEDPEETNDAELEGFVEVGWGNDVGTSEKSSTYEGPGAERACKSLRQDRCSVHVVCHARRSWHLHAQR